MNRRMQSPTNYQHIQMAALVTAASLVFAGCAAPPQPTPSTAGQSTQVDLPVENSLGRQVYERTCAECHGVTGEGYANNLKAPALDASEHAWHHPDGHIQRLIQNGGRLMPALGDQLTPEETRAVIEHMHTLWTPEQLESQQATSKFDPLQ